MLKDKIIAVDFDGTLSFGSWPECGKPNVRLIKWLNECKENGCKLILWTMREGKTLEDALIWCKEHGLEFDAANDNLPEMKMKYQNNPRKIYCDFLIDDTHFTSEYLIAKTKIPDEFYEKNQKNTAKIF